VRLNSPFGGAGGGCLLDFLPLVLSILEVRLNSPFGGGRGRMLIWFPPLTPSEGGKKEISLWRNYPVTISSP